MTSFRGLLVLLLTLMLTLVQLAAARRAASHPTGLAAGALQLARDAAAVNGSVLDHEDSHTRAAAVELPHARAPTSYLAVVQKGKLPVLTVLLVSLTVLALLAVVLACYVLKPSALEGQQGVLPNKLTPSSSQSADVEHHPLVSRFSVRKGSVQYKEGCAGSKMLDDMDLDVFDKLADAGELDIFSCIALCAGRHKLGAETRRYLPGLITAIFMQLVLPALLVAYNIAQVSYYTDNQSLLFRTIGGGLYIYSINNLYDGALDECRSWVMSAMFDHNVSQWYVWPVLLGELCNAFASWAIAVTLFLIFCSVPTAEELLLNCVAINFLVEIDNNLTSDWMKEETRTNFEVAIEVWKDAGEPPPCRHNSWIFVKYLCKFVRVFGTLGMGYVFFFVFTFGHLSSLCLRFQPYHPAPFCTGLPYYEPLDSFGRHH